MPKFLPLFPLKLVVYPGENLNLHIFEPRYVQLIRDVMQKNSGFGIPVYLDGRIEEYGTEMKILSIEKTYEDGKMDIRTQGKGVIRVLEFLREVPGKLYPAGIVSEIETDTGVRLNTQLFAFFHKLHQLLGTKPVLNKREYDLRSYDFAHFVGMSLEEKYHMLTMIDERERQNFLLAHLKSSLPLLEEAEKLKEKIRLNGHFRKEISPE